MNSTATSYLPIVYGTYMASIDVFMLSMLKAISLGWIGKAALILPMAIYAFQPVIFLTSLKYESMVVMNLLWDVLSDVLVTFTGLYFFQEKITRTKMIGIGFAIIAVFLLTWGDICD